VIAPTPQARAAERKARAEAAAAGDKIKEGAAEAAQHAGSELKNEGEKAQSHRSTETTETISTVETPATSTTATETRTRVSRRH
jgi:hypothetical protein